MNTKIQVALSSIALCSISHAAIIVINPSSIPTLISGTAYSTVPAAQVGVPLSTTVPGLTVTLSGSGLQHRNDNFAAVGVGAATIAFNFDPLCGTVTGVTAEHGAVISGGANFSDIVTFNGLGNAISLIDGAALASNFTDVTTGTDNIGRVNKGSNNPNNAGTPLLWEASAPAQSGSVTYESTSTGNAGFFFTIEYDPITKPVPEPTSSALVALAGLSLLGRRKRA